MKLGTIVKVIASAPAHGQDDISHLIGKTFAVRAIDRDVGTVSVDGNNGLIVLQRAEYEEALKKAGAK